MTTRLEIETSIKKLSKSDVRQLAVWLQAYLDELWDQQIEADLAAGKLSGLIAKAEADVVSGNLKDLNELLHHK